MSSLDTRYGSGAMDQRKSEQGFLLVGVIVMVALVLLVLSLAAPVVAKDLRRERELEAVQRGQQYTHAIRLFYKKFNTYPASVEALEKTSNVRYLRQRYVDPMTGKQDWRKIGFGQAKTTVKGFFGQPLSGLGGAGSLGSASGLASSQQPGQSTFGGAQSGIQGAQNTVGSPGGTASAGSPGVAGATSTGGAGTDSGSSSFGSSSFGSSSFGSSSQSGGGSGSSGPFVGVGIPKDGASIIDLNEQTDYSTWEFIYDPRIEQLYSKVSLFGGGPASTSSGSLGSASSLSGSGSGNNAFGNNNGGSGNANGGAGNSNGGASSNGGGATSNGNGGTTGTGGTGNPTTPQPQ